MKTDSALSQKTGALQPEEDYRKALEEIAGNNWKDQSRARHVARTVLEKHRQPKAA